jgi:hypothetical protein
MSKVGRFFVLDARVVHWSDLSAVINAATVLVGAPISSRLPVAPITMATPFSGIPSY